MPDITIDNLRVAPTLGARVPTKWKAFAQSDFQVNDTDGTLVKATSPYDMGAHYKEGALTLSGSVYVAADFTLPATTDSPNNPNGARWGLYVFDANNRVMFAVSGLESFALDHTDLVQTPEDIIAFNTDTLPTLSDRDISVPGSLTVGSNMTVGGAITADSFNGDLVGSPNVTTDLSVARDLSVVRHIVGQTLAGDGSAITNLATSGITQDSLSSTGSIERQIDTDASGTGRDDFYVGGVLKGYTDHDGGLVYPYSTTPDKGAQMYNAKVYGAKADGTDDEPEIQAALDACSAAGGGIVFLPTGSYYIGNTLLIPSGVTLMGAGRGLSNITPLAGDIPGKTVNSNEVFASIAMVGVNRAGVVGITVDHSLNETTTNGIAMLPDGVNNNGTPATNCLIENCEVLGFNSHQYLIWNLRGQHNKIINNWLNGNVVSTDLTSEQEGIESYGGLDVLISGNTILNIGASGVNVFSGGGSMTDSSINGVRVVNNFIDGARVGINFFPGDSQVCENVTIFGNQVINSGVTGITILAAAGSIVKNVLIGPNIVQGAGTEGIRVIGTATSSVAGVELQNNSIELTDSPATAQGIVIALFGALKISGGSIRNANCGILVNGVSNLTINGVNIEDSKGNGIQVGSSGAVDSEDIFITDNNILRFNAGDASNAGVYMELVTRGAVTGNTFQTDNDYIAVQVPSGDEIEVTGNRLLYASALDDPFVNNCTNPNATFFNPTAGTAQNTVVTNSLATKDARIIVIQESGTPSAFTVTKATGSFTVKMAALMTGAEVIRYEIIQ